MPYFVTLMLAPASTRILMIAAFFSSNLQQIARCMGVLSYLSFAAKSAPAAIRDSTASRGPIKACRCKGVEPPLFFAFTSAPALSKMPITFTGSPPETQQRTFCRGVAPFLFLAFTSAPNLTSTLAVSASALDAALCKGV